MCMTFPFLIAMHCDDLNHNRESTNPGFSRAASRSEDCVVACFQISCRNITPEASFMAFARHTCEKRHNVFLIDVLQHVDAGNHSCKFQLSMRMCIWCNLLYVE